MASLAGGGSGGGVEAEATAADWRLHHPARLELIGPSGCGKSETMLKLAADDSVWTLEEEDGRSGPVFRDLIYCAPSLDDREDFLRRLSLVACVVTRTSSTPNPSRHGRGGDPSSTWWTTCLLSQTAPA